MSHLHLLLAGRPPASPSLDRLIARGQPAGPMPSGTTAALCRAFGMTAALAPVLLEAEGLAPDSGHWLRADPVHLLAGMHSVSLLDSRRFRIDAGEAQALVAALNRHFGAEARFVAPDPARWYVGFPVALDADAPAPEELAGLPVEPHRVTGPDAARLHRFAMEAQMLLHDQPLNDEREARGELAINGLWFWGGGAPGRPARRFDQVFADDFSARALGLAAGATPASPPERFTPLAGNSLAVLDMEHGGGFESGWFAPILSALQRGRLQSLVLEIAGQDGCCLRLGRADAWKFWRREPGA